MIKITLRAARVNAGLSQKEAAKELGISNRTLCKWESYLSFPPANKISEICDLYRVSYDNLNFLPSDSVSPNYRKEE